MEHEIKRIPHDDGSTVYTCGVWILARAYPDGMIVRAAYWNAPPAMRFACDDAMRADGHKVD